MSAISDYYVNFYTTHYLHNEKYQNNQPISNFIWHKLQSKINTTRSGATKAEIEQYVNFLNSLMGRNNTINKSISNKVQEAIVNNLQNRASQIVDLITEKANNGALTGTVQNDLGDQLQQILHQRFGTVGKGNKFIISKQRIKSALTTYNKALRDAYSGLLDLKNKNTLQQAINTTDNLLKELDNILGDSIKKAKDNNLPAKIQGTINALNNQYGGAYSLQQLNKKDQGLLYILNGLIESINGIQAINTTAQGDFFEEFGVMASYLMEYNVEDALDKFLNDISNQNGRWQGKTAPKLYYSTDGQSQKLTAKIAKLNKNKIIQSGEQKFMVSTRGSQQKVDVLVSYPGEFGRIDIPASFKNYSIHSNMVDMGLVNDTNAWYLLSDESPDFLRKYLNIMAEHRPLSKPNSEYVSQIEQNSIQYLQSKRKEAIFAMQLLSIYKAITGDTFQRIGVKWLVINNTKTQKIQIIEIADLILSLIYKLNSFNINNYFSFPDTNFNIQYLNSWVEGVNGELERMARLINSVHQQKISVAIKYKGLIDIAGFKL